jgi:hypothetical protein
MRPLEVYERPTCACCGKLITWEVAEVERLGRLVRFCSGRCAGVFDSSVLPTYGAAAVAHVGRPVAGAPASPARAHAQPAEEDW